jgi:two-component system sensor histidine kinase ChvG
MRRFLSRISIRLLAFNVLLVFLPASGVFYLDVYENQLLRAQERSMVQQGRLLAAALSNQGPITSEAARRILIELDQRTRARLRVVNSEGWLVADSSLPGSRREPSEELSSNSGNSGDSDDARYTREIWLYRLGASAYRLLSRFLDPDRTSSLVEEHYSSPEPLLGPEVRAALAGRYGAATRLESGQRSVTLFSAIPVRDNGQVVGAVLVSQSTYGLHADLDEVRLAIFEVFLASVAVAVVLSLLVSTTIARPLKQIRLQAAALVDRRGRLKGRFRGSNRQDELGELARGLEDLSRRLEETVGFIESFAADVSHEFKNPLASIRNATEILAEVEDPGERRRFLNVAESEIARMEKLLSAVREITTIDAELDEEEKSPVSLNEILAGVVEGVRHRPGANVALSLELPDDTLTVHASPERLVQVFENLIDNAVSFSPPGGEVTIRLRKGSARAMVTVEDHGPGIPPEHLDRIFKRFFSYRPAADGETTTGKHKHTGLGLAIVKTIVEGYGGAISAVSGPKGGATFCVELSTV